MQGTRSVPSQVSEVMDGLRGVSDSMAEAMLEDLADDEVNIIYTFSGTDQLEPDWVHENPLGLPDSFHRIACETVRLEAAEDGQIVSIVYRE